MLDIDKIDWSSVEIDGINTSDYPDFCDAFVSYAIDTNGNELTEEQLDSLTEHYGSTIHELIFDRIF